MLFSFTSSKLQKLMAPTRFCNVFSAGVHVYSANCSHALSSLLFLVLTIGQMFQFLGQRFKTHRSDGDGEGKTLD